MSKPVAGILRQGLLGHPSLHVAGRKPVRPAARTHRATATSLSARDPQTRGHCLRANDARSRYVPVSGACTASAKAAPVRADARAARGMPDAFAAHARSASARNGLAPPNKAGRSTAAPAQPHLVRRTEPRRHAGAPVSRPRPRHVGAVFCMAAFRAFPPGARIIYKTYLLRPRILRRIRPSPMTPRNVSEAGSRR